LNIEGHLHLSQQFVDFFEYQANCNDNGREILVLGSMEWMSEHGFLPGDLFGLLFFYSGLAGVYLFLVITYWCGMKMYQDSAIPIQRYILTTLVLGFLESFLLTMDLYILNDRGNRWEAVVYAGEFPVLDLASDRTACGESS
jgi:hypothetical protein